METEEEKAEREAIELKKREEEELNSQKSEAALKEEEEEKKAKADKLLDGTDKNKKIVVKKEPYDDRNEKAKIYETHAELLDAVLKDPETVKKFLKEKDGGDVESRIERLESERKAEKRSQLRDAVADMISEYPDFEKSWDNIRPLADTLMEQGFSPKQAIRRGFLAAHPEAAEKEAKRIADEALNRGGEFRGGGFSVRTGKSKDELSDDEKKIAQGLIKQGRVKSEEDYAKILENHKDWIERQMRNIGE